MKKLMGIDCELFASNEGNGVKQELYKSVSDEKGIVVITDTEANKIVGMKKYLDFNDAAHYYDGCLPY